MRPGLIHPGNVARALGRPAYGTLASMRPGLIHPGNTINANADNIETLPASMRPGLIHPAGALATAEGWATRKGSLQ